jgi:hypothetical protein
LSPFTVKVLYPDVTFLDFRLKKLQLSLHFITPSNLVDKLPLEGVGFFVQVPELYQTELA